MATWVQTESFRRAIGNSKTIVTWSRSYPASVRSTVFGRNTVKNRLPHLDSGDARSIRVARARRTATSKQTFFSFRVPVNKLVTPQSKQGKRSKLLGGEIGLKDIRKQPTALSSYQTITRGPCGTGCCIFAQGNQLLLRAIGQ